MMKSKYIVGALAAFALLVLIAQLRQCTGTGSQTSDPAKPAPATTAPAPASTAPTPPPAPVEPPDGIQRGYAERRVVGQDQYGQWQTIAADVVPLEALDITVPALKKGTVGKRRTEYSAYIRTDAPTSIVMLHAVGYTASVQAQIDGWYSPVLRHSNAWTTDASVARHVVSLSPGWHRVVLSITQSKGFVDGPTSARLQLGSASLDPTIPTPYAVPDEDTATPAAASSTPASAVTAPTPATSAPAAPTSAAVEASSADAEGGDHAS